MIRQKLNEFFFWIKDHFHCLVEVVVRLKLGIEKKENPKATDVRGTSEKGESNDCSSN